MSDWAPVDQAAKDASGNFQVLTGGQWRPAAKVAKNAEGRFMALLDDGVAAPAPVAAPTTPPGVIPGQEGEAARVAGLQARPQPGLLARLKGVGEAVIDQALGAVGGGAGAAGGLLGGVAGALQQAFDRRAQPEGGVERSAAEGAQRGAEALKSSVYGLTGAPSRTGQEYSEKAGQFIAENAPSIMAGPAGVVGLTRQAPEGAGNAAAQAAAPAGAAVRAGGEAALDAALPKLSPSNLARVTTATEAGIPVSPHQLAPNKFLKLFGEFAENIPFAGGDTLRKTRKEKLSGALAKVIDPATDATVLDSANFAKLQDSAGERIGGVASRTDVPIESFGDVSTITSKAKPDSQSVIAAYAKDLATAAEQNGGAVPGSTLRELRTQVTSQARRVRSSDGDLAHYLDNLAKRMDDALGEHATEADMETLAEARRQYAVSKALEPLVAAFPNGDFPPSRLKSVVTNTAAGKTRMAKGQAGELGEYARLGQEILKDQVSSGTAERNLVYGAAGGLGLGGAATVSLPGALAAWGSAGIYNLLGPRVVKALAERQQRRNAPKPEGPPPEPTLAAGFEDVPQGGVAPTTGPLGDLTPDWQTAPGAAPARGGEVVPAEGLVPAVDEVQPMRVQPAGAAPEAEGAALRGAGEQIPAVPGRPDLPDTMVVGPPAEAGATEAAGAAMQAPEAALARQKQAEAVLQRAQVVQSPEVKKVLETHAAKLALEAKRIKDAADLRREAALTTDPTVRQALFDHAKRLERAEKVAIGEAKEVGSEKPKPAAKAEKPIPVPEATEVPVEEVVAPNPDLVFEDGKGWVKRIPAGEATEVPAETVVYDAKGRALEVGRTYADGKGRRAVWQADGTWKILK